MVTDAKEAHLFRSWDELLKFTLSQIKDLNDLPSKEPIDIDELINVGLMS